MDAIWTSSFITNSDTGLGEDQKMKLNKRIGFTLIEIIVVIIIVGVLAGLALPRFINSVEFSRSTEALNSMSVIRKSVNRCKVFSNDINECDISLNGLLEFSEIDIDDPGTANNAGALFDYTITINDVDAFTIVATRNTTDGGTAGDTVTLDDAGGVVTKSGTGAFSSIN